MERFVTLVASSSKNCMQILCPTFASHLYSKFRFQILLGAVVQWYPAGWYVKSPSSLEYIGHLPKSAE